MITFVLRKSTKTAATRAVLFDFSTHQIVALPQTPMGALQRSPDTLAVFMGPTSKGKGWEGIGENGRGGERREGEKGRGKGGRWRWREGDRRIGIAGEGGEFVLCPRKKKQKSAPMRIWISKTKWGFTCPKNPPGNFPSLFQRCKPNCGKCPPISQAWTTLQKNS